MWHIPGELHDASLRCMRRLMHCLLLLPPRPQKRLKILYTIVLLIYLIFITNWRFSFNYTVVYDIQNDYASRIIDLQKFVGLITCHAVIAMELLWKNRNAEVELQLQRMRHTLRVQFGYFVNLRRIRLYCNILMGSLILRVLMFAGMTIYVNLVTDNLVLLFYDFYSEVILLMRFSEFTIYSSLILCFYRDLSDVSSTLIEELESTDSQMSSLRRILIDRLSMLQHLHGLLWNTIRKIEQNFEWSLITVMLKFFMDASVLPYWIYINVSSTTCWAIILFCLAEQCGKLVEIIVPCQICDHCGLLYRQLRAMFHTLSSDRCNYHLNLAVIRMSSQLGQEQCFFSAGGLLLMNNVTLGKFIFGIVSYFVRELMMSDNHTRISY